MNSFKPNKALSTILEDFLLTQCSSNINIKDIIVHHVFDKSDGLELSLEIRLKDKYVFKNICLTDNDLVV